MANSDQGPVFEDAGGPAGTQEWYVTLGDEVFGPADKATLAQWAMEGRLPANAMAVAVGNDQWAPIGSVPELRSLPFPGPPRPTAPAYRHTPSPMPQRRLSSCPHCEGPVSNVAPAYGWPWGFFQRSLKPEFRCGQCGASVAYEALSPTGQAQVTRSVRTGFAIWLLINIGLLAFIGFCVFTALSAFQ